MCVLQFHPTNWAGNYPNRARRVHRPATLDELREIVARAPRVVGSRHSFSDIGDSPELVTLEGLPADVVVDHGAGTVAVPAAMTYGDLAVKLAPEGVALHNLASLPHISVGGAIATATHGSGDRAGNLATQVAGLELVTSCGGIRTLSRSDPEFEGVVVGLGAAGAVTRVTLDVEPAYHVRQRVFEGLRWKVLLEQLDAVSASAASVSVFTRWQEDVDQVWLKHRVTDEPEEIVDELFGAAAATADRHPIPGADPVSCTPQLGAARPLVRPAPALLQRLRFGRGKRSMRSSPSKPLSRRSPRGRTGASCSWAARRRSRRSTSACRTSSRSSSASTGAEPSETSGSSACWASPPDPLGPRRVGCAGSERPAAYELGNVDGVHASSLPGLCYQRK